MNIFDDITRERHEQAKLREPLLNTIFDLAREYDLYQNGGNGKYSIYSLVLLLDILTKSVPDPNKRISWTPCSKTLKIIETKTARPNKRKPEIIDDTTQFDSSEEKPVVKAKRVKLSSRKITLSAKEKHDAHTRRYPNPASLGAISKEPTPTVTETSSPVLAPARLIQQVPVLEGLDQLSSTDLDAWCAGSFMSGSFSSAYDSVHDFDMLGEATGAANTRTSMHGGFDQPSHPITIRNGVDSTRDLEMNGTNMPLLDSGPGANFAGFHGGYMQTPMHTHSMTFNVNPDGGFRSYQPHLVGAHAPVQAQGSRQTAIDADQQASAQRSFLGHDAPLHAGMAEHRFQYANPVSHPHGLPMPYSGLSYANCAPDGTPFRFEDYVNTGCNTAHEQQPLMPPDRIHIGSDDHRRHSRESLLSTCCLAEERLLTQNEPEPDQGHPHWFL